MSKSSPPSETKASSSTEEAPLLVVNKQDIEYGTAENGAVGKFSIVADLPSVPSQHGKAGILVSELGTVYTVGSICPLYDVEIPYLISLTLDK